MTTARAPHPDHRPLLDPYELGRTLAGLLRHARMVLDRASRPARDTSIAWEDGEAEERSDSR